ncbi:MAG TPA: HEPN domain-containing protein [Rhodothermales bacterium]|nr:HEPN domain-containing protein [Rhodothermales bacterium]
MKRTVALFEKAARALHSAHVLLEAGGVDGAINRAYFAAFYAATAALICVGESPKTHKGTHNRFWVRFVETGLISRQIGDALGYGWRMRENADYDIYSIFDTTAAADLLRDVEAFVQATEALVKNLEAGEG